MECSGDASEPGGVDIRAQFNSNNLGSSEAACKGEVLDTISRCLARLLDSETYIDAAQTGVSRR